MTKCFVEPPEEHDYEEPVRGVPCDPEAPACRDWIDRETGISLTSNEILWEKFKSACCGNCYYCHEV